MALTGLDIFKLLPKTNCGDCGKPTCLAFAMQLAAKKASLDECPHASPAAKEALAGASAPPIRKVTIGIGDTALVIGEETVLFRHEEKFHHPAGVAVRVMDDLGEAQIKARVEKINRLEFERVGQRLAVDLIAVENKSGSGATFARAAKTVADNTKFGLVLISSSPENMKPAVDAVKARKPLVYGADATNFAAMAAIAKEAACPLGVVADGIEALAELTEKIKAAGVQDMVLDPGSRDLKTTLHNLTRIRRAALKRTFRPLGFPTIAFACSEDPFDEIARASTFMTKYAAIIVVDSVEPSQIIPLLTVRQNIYTDPQKPIQVKPGLYEIGDVSENSPVMFTTNFSLTYFTVEGDVSASRVPSYIIAVNTEGMSVLTAYSGDKLNEKVVAEAIKSCGIESKVKHRKLIIPGYVAVMSGKLEEATGWEVLVGPKESSFIPKFLQTQWKS